MICLNTEVVLYAEKKLMWKWGGKFKWCAYYKAVESFQTQGIYGNLLTDVPWLESQQFWK